MSTPSPPERRLTPGEPPVRPLPRTELGEYRLVGCHEPGSARRVVRAVDGRGRQVVIRRIPLGVSDVPPRDLRARVRCLETLRHPQIPDFVGSFVAFSQGRFFLHLVQEHVPGRDLVARLGTEPWSVETVLEVVVEVAEILQALHARRRPIAHGQLTPRHLIANDDLDLYLVGFPGVPTLAPSSLRSECDAPYRAPELLRSAAIPASDIFALGATAAHLLDGQPPLPGLPWLPARSVPESVEWMITAMMVRDPALRPTAREVVRLAELSGAALRPMASVPPHHLFDGDDVSAEPHDRPWPAPPRQRWPSEAWSEDPLTAPFVDEDPFAEDLCTMPGVAAPPYPEPLLELARAAPLGCERHVAGPRAWAQLESALRDAIVAWHDHRPGSSLTHAHIAAIEVLHVPFFSFEGPVTVALTHRVRERDAASWGEAVRVHRDRQRLHALEERLYEAGLTLWVLQRPPHGHPLAGRAFDRPRPPSTPSSPPPRAADHTTSSVRTHTLTPHLSLSTRPVPLPSFDRPDLPWTPDGFADSERDEPIVGPAAWQDLPAGLAEARPLIHALLEVEAALRIRRRLDDADQVLESLDDASVRQGLTVTTVRIFRVALQRGRHRRIVHARVDPHGTLDVHGERLPALPLERLQARGLALSSPLVRRAAVALLVMLALGALAICWG